MSFKKYYLNFILFLLFNNYLPSQEFDKDFLESLPEEARNQLITEIRKKQKDRQKERPRYPCC